jgi:hypothetical protein
MEWTKEIDEHGNIVDVFTCDPRLTPQQNFIAAHNNFLEKQFRECAETFVEKFGPNGKIILRFSIEEKPR